MTAMSEQERWEHGVGPAPRQYDMVICQVCGGPLLRGLPRHPDCKPVVVYNGRERNGGMDNDDN